jgi:hypothetical protein
LPLSCSFGNGTFEWNKDTRVSFEGNEDDWAIVKTAFTETNLPVSYEADNTKTNSIRLELVDAIEGISSPEGYSVHVGEDGVSIKALSDAGLFYGVQSLIQLAEQGKGRVQFVDIVDEPRFPYRGIMLDVSRHFRSKEFVKKQIDLLSHYKFNRLHLHLTDARMNAYVGCVAKAVTAQVPASYGITSWEVVVFDSKEINAFALPGGKIGVYSGLLKVAKNQDQLATVIGHELTHVLAQHSNERLSRDQLTGIGLAVADAAIGSSDSLGGAATMAALGLGVQVGIALPYGRTQESEADRLGLELMARAGFNPAEAVTLWQNMSAASGGKAPPQLLSTHPSDQSRIANLQAQQAEVQPLYQQAKASGLVPQCKA